MRAKRRPVSHGWRTRKSPSAMGTVLANVARRASAKRRKLEITTSQQMQLRCHTEWEKRVKVQRRNMGKQNTTHRGEQKWRTALEHRSLRHQRYQQRSSSVSPATTIVCVRAHRVAGVNIWISCQSSATGVTPQRETLSQNIFINPFSQPPWRRYQGKAWWEDGAAEQQEIIDSSGTKKG